MNIQKFVDVYNKTVDVCKQMMLKNIYLFSENEHFEDIEFISLSDSGDSISVQARIRVEGSNEEGIQTGSMGLCYFIPLYAFESEENMKKWIDNTNKYISAIKDIANNKEFPDWLKDLKEDT